MLKKRAAFNKIILTLSTGASKKFADAAKEASMAGDKISDDDDADADDDADDDGDGDEETLPYTDADGRPRPREYDLPDGFACTAVCHPDTYLNKILLGSSDGRLLLLNVSTGRNVHVFAPEVSECMKTGTETAAVWE